MELNGREIRFRRSVYADHKIAKISPDHDPNKLGKLLKSGDLVAGLETMIAFVCAMSEAYEKHAKRENPEYIPNPVTEEELLDETSDFLSDLFMQAAAVFTGDGKPTVEAEAPKGKNGEAASE